MYLNVCTLAIALSCLMSQILTPFLLRRLKSDVELKIPPKKEVLVYAPITPLQAKLYRGVLEENVLGTYIFSCPCVVGGGESH